MLSTDAELESLLRGARTIAIVGASAKTDRDANISIDFLGRAGYEVYPINPTISGELYGRKVYPDVKSLPIIPDIVVAYRNSDAIPGIVDEAIAAHVGAVWAVLGISSDAAADRAAAAELPYVEDHCIMTEYKRQIAWKKQ